MDGPGEKRLATQSGLCGAFIPSRGQFVPSRRRRMMANVRADPGRTQPRAAYPQRRSSNANGLRGQNSAGSPQIYATFQRDNLRRHFLSSNLTCPATQSGLCAAFIPFMGTLPFWALKIPAEPSPRAAYPQRRSSNANSLQSQNSAGFPQICAIFQRVGRAAPLTVVARTRGIRWPLQPVARPMAARR
jgi:hypothetical protein